ncbi:unnamed protein product [Paramecium sonneborni]|uniref:Uncharacterized protein n=1 Tax=Paramecium sonneborni TaxID=65129 RepID=A0A8S1QK43_9CILI|nr:unnamed protein product [Paramecium sonneborni]
MFNSNENVLEERLPQNYIDVKLTLWKKSSIIQDFKQNSFFSTIHIYNDRLLICYSQKTELHGVYINREKFNIEEHFVFSGEQFDYQFVHPQTYFTKNCIWFISYNRATQQQIFYADLPTKTILSIKSEYKPQFRINFSFTQIADLSFYIFGGLDEQMRLSNQLDFFQVTQCDFTPVNFKGQPPSPRHSHLAFVNINKLIIAGGSQSTNLFERTSLQDMYSLDLKTFTWSQVKTNIPRSIAFGQYVSLNQNQLIYFAEENGQTTHYLLSFTDNQWTCMRSQKEVPSYKYRACACLDIKNNQILLFGGYNFQKNIVNCNVVERLQIITKDFKEQTLLDYNGDLINISKFEKQLQQQQQNLQFQEDNKDNDQPEELTFEELLEQEKQLQQLQQDEIKQETKKSNKKNNKKKNKYKSKN